MNRLLERQLKKCFGGKEFVPREMTAFINVISAAYDSFDNDLKLMERSFDISSLELTEANEDLKRLIDKTKRAKAQLEGSRKALKVIIDSMPFGVIVVGLDRKILIVNEEAVKITGYDSTEDLLGHFCDHCFGPVEDGLCPILDRGQSIDKDERNLITRDGRTIPILKSVIPIKLGDKDALLEGFIDLSHIKKAEKEKKELEMQLVQAQKLETIGTLAGGIAHDFNNILGIIFGYAELIKKGANEDENLVKNVEQLLKASRYGRDLVSQILTFSRHAEPVYKPIKLQELVEESLKLMKVSLPSTITIEKEIDPYCAEVVADDTQMKQVMANLCTNAGHSMGQNGGVLTVRMREKEITSDFVNIHPQITAGKHIMIIVSDTGHGMDDVTIKRIFEPFFTTKNLKGEMGGVGLGLSVIQGSITQHKGLITVSSEINKGSVFSVYLPVNEESVKKDVVSEKSAPQKQAEIEMRGKETILFVDDEEHIVIVGKQMLEQIGYTVEGVKNAREALNKFRLDPAKYDLVITDQIMPELTGSELAKELLDIKPDIPIILTTGYSDTVTKENYRKHGIKEFLLKPLSVKDLCRAIRRAVN